VKGDCYCSSTTATATMGTTVTAITATAITAVTMTAIIGECEVEESELVLMNHGKEKV
jgi:hypothetical protein